MDASFHIVHDDHFETICVVDAGSLSNCELLIILTL